MQQGSSSSPCFRHIASAPTFSFAALVFGLSVVRDAEHNRANLLAWCIANRNQAAVGFVAEIYHLLL
jgi:hypothetical protein